MDVVVVASEVVEVIESIQLNEEAVSQQGQSRPVVKHSSKCEQSHSDAPPKTYCPYPSA
jgi:hypothetical protein